MKNPTHLIALVASLVAAPALAQQELTINGDFEAGDATGFNVFVGPPERTFEVVSDPVSGSFIGEINNTLSGNPAVIQQANLGVGVVTPGETIEISFDARGEFGVGGVAFAEFFSELDGGGTSSSAILGGGPLSLTNVFQTFTFTAVTGPDVAGGVTLQFNAATGAITGSTAFLAVDNLSVTRTIPEPAAASLLAFGGLATLLRRRQKAA